MFKITQKVEGESSLGKEYPPGVYENGLLTITTEKDSIDLAESIDWDVYHKYKVVAYNCMGDLFIQGKESNDIGYLWLQYGYGRYITGSPKEWMHLISTEGEDKEKFLETSAYSHLLKLKGPLTYGSVYALAPILALGGDTTIKGLNNSYIGHLNNYLSIVSQSFVPEGWGEFA